MFRMTPKVFILSLTIAKDVIAAKILLYMSFKYTFIKNLELQKNLLSVRDFVEKWKRQATDLEKIFANRISAKGLVSRLYKELPKLNSKNNNTT